MRSKWNYFLLFGLTLIAYSLFSSCSNQPSAQERAAQEFFVTASEYLHEFSSITSLTESRLTKAEDLMRDGEMDMRELDKSFHEIYFTEATTIEFLDNLPEYSSLHDVMWEDGNPPEFNCGSDDYFCQNDFKQQHALALNNVGDFIQKLEEDLGIKLQYQPTWNTDTPSDNKTQGNSGVLDLWIELQSVEDTLDNLPDNRTTMLSPPTNESKNHFEQGNMYLDQEDWDNAVSEYTKAIDLNLDDAEAFVGRGIANTWAGNYKRAENDFDTAYYMSFESFMTYNANVAWGIAITGQHNCGTDEAEYFFDRAISDDPDNSYAYTGRALMHLKEAYCWTIGYESDGAYHLRKAISDFDKAIELDIEGIEGLTKRFDFEGDMAFLANYIKANIERGTLLTDEYGSFDDAIGAYQKALELEPKNVEALVGLGIAYVGLQQYDLAFKIFNSVTELDPGNSYPYASANRVEQLPYIRGNLYMENEEWWKAFREYGKAIELNPIYAEAYAQRGLASWLDQIYNSTRDCGSYSVPDSEKALELNPNIVLDKRLADAYALQGECDYERSDYEEAIIKFAKAIELDPNVSSRRPIDVYDALIFESMMYREYGAAIEYAMKAIALNTDDNDSYSKQLAEAYSGRADYEDFDRDKKIEDYTRAIEVAPNDAKYYIRRAGVYMGLADYYRSGDQTIEEFDSYDKAIADYTKAIEYSPEEPLGYSGRGSSYLNKRDYYKAIADFVRAIELGEINSSIYMGLGLAQENLGNIAEAINDYQKALALEEWDWMREQILKNIDRLQAR